MKRADGGIVVGAVGTAFVAFLGTLCCAGPAVVGVIGAGGALAAARLEPYRPYLLAVSSLFLAIGFWRAYVPSGWGPSGTVCTVRTGRRVRTILWIAALVTLSSALAPHLR